MQTDKNRAIAALRAMLGKEGRSMSQTAFAEIVGCALPTIQSIETGRLKLSEGLAAKIFAATGADAGWLLKNDPTVPLLDWRTGAPYTRAIFEELQSKRRLPTNLAKYNFRRYLLDQLGRMSLFLEHVEEQSHEAVSVFMYRFEKMLDEMESDLGKGWVSPKGNRLQAVCRMVGPWLEAKIHVLTPEQLAEAEKKYGHLLNKSARVKDASYATSPPEQFGNLSEASDNPVSRPVPPNTQRTGGSKKKAR